MWMSNEHKKQQDKGIDSMALSYLCMEDSIGIAEVIGQLI